jgi:N-acetylneuraminate synthase
MTAAPYFIAEAGVNHNGSETMALRLVDIASEAGADAVKFQTFKADSLVTETVAACAYQQERSDAQTQRDLLTALELPEKSFVRVAEHAAAAGIEFMSTAFDTRSLDFLVTELGVKKIKIASGEITNPELLLSAARTGLPIVVSTGMANLSDVEFALGVIAFGRISTAEPTLEACARAWAKGAPEDVTLLHCVTAYPTPPEQVNLRAMETLAAAFGLPVGYSDHTEGLAASVAAVARGAKIIEKHFTMDRGLIGPDHAASLEPHELKELVGMCREAAQCLGDFRKAPVTAEAANAGQIRRSVVARRAIAPGEVLGAQNLTTKRSAGGADGRLLWGLFGRRADRAYEKDEPVR